MYELPPVLRARADSLLCWRCERVQDELRRPNPVVMRRPTAQRKCGFDEPLHILPRLATAGRLLNLQNCAPQFQHSPAPVARLGVTPHLCSKLTGNEIACKIEPLIIARVVHSLSSLRQQEVVLLLKEGWRADN
jgi:hypothetical protein